MESRFSAHVLLCGLVLSICIAWADCELPDNMVEDINYLKKTLNLSNLKDKPGSFFKKLLQAMEKQFEREDQRLVVLEMMSAYSRIFDQISRETTSQRDSRIPTLRHHMKIMRNDTVLDNSRKLCDMQRTIRDYKTSSPVEQLRALDDFPVVYERASELTQPKPKKKFHH